MKALIFNSGIGSRMGKLTADRPKCLVKLPNGETILSRQLRILGDCGIDEAVITTGKYTAEIKKEAEKSPLKITIVENPKYASTNYIYSMYLAEKHTDDDILMLHGDLVFDSEIVKRIIESERTDVCAVSFTEPLPEKDFKGRFCGGLLKEVSVDIFGDNCFALQPMYKLSKNVMKLWNDRVSDFVREGKTSVYAENALNELLDEIKIYPVSYDGCFISEIDDENDFLRVGYEIAFRDLMCGTKLEELPEFIEKTGSLRPFAVVGKHCRNDFAKVTSELEIRIFSEYKENPDEESIKKAAAEFEAYGGDLLISMGGGSVIDTAKGIEALCGRDIPHISIPTTAGSGSEATRFSVFYKDGVKHSFDSPELLPNYVIADSRQLYSLSREQRMTTLLDAYCHAVESLLSVNATAESRYYAERAISLIKVYYGEYADGRRNVYGMIMAASHYAGKAINISRTAAGHAMSYVLTSDYGLKHGRAAAVCLKNIFTRLSETGRLSQEMAENYELLVKLYKIADFKKSISEKPEAIELAKKVNGDRLKNFSIKLSEDDIVEIYKYVIRDIFL